MARKEFKIVYRLQGAPVERTETIEVTSWAQVGGQLGSLAGDCDSILVYCGDKIVLRYDPEGLD